eukprot:CAMPEP_0172601402 /NCGR_PEP_ID=MMETSP1068-20121228/21547_1 /TAXON_ID=35684 /ORGANISM="Pseudopedinella elastica, Strain CCMP716" /LENGTH=180 /DNA_ID=CAMNT_0013402367 /DNA_START=42 /DNA_END=584 /DNA_ORIENTATION=-
MEHGKATLLSKLSYFRSILDAINQPCIEARLNADAGSSDIDSYLSFMEKLRNGMTERTHSSLSVKVKSAKETERQLDDTFAERKHELDAAQKHKEALCLNCDTVDQALENVLRETKSEYQNLTKRNELCSSLSLELERLEKEAETLNSRCRIEENKKEALKKQAANNGIIFTGRGNRPHS